MRPAQLGRLVGTTARSATARWLHASAAASAAALPALAAPAAGPCGVPTSPERPGSQLQPRTNGLMTPQQAFAAHSLAAEGSAPSAGDVDEVVARLREHLELMFSPVAPPSGMCASPHAAPAAAPAAVPAATLRSSAQAVAARLTKPTAADVPLTLEAALQPSHQARQVHAAGPWGFVAVQLRASSLWARPLVFASKAGWGLLSYLGSPACPATALQRSLPAQQLTRWRPLPWLPPPPCRLLVESHPPYRLSWANPAWEQLAGLDWGEVEGQPCLEVVAGSLARSEGAPAGLVDALAAHARGSATVEVLQVGGGGGHRASTSSAAQWLVLETCSPAHCMSGRLAAASKELFPPPVNLDS